jgi:hypothetical protein
MADAFTPDERRAFDDAFKDWLKEGAQHHRPSDAKMVFVAIK